MAITLEPVLLESRCGDDEGMLALRDGHVFAILARLGGLHGEQVGRWFVEAVFAERLSVGEIFSTLPDFVARAAADGWPD